MRKLNRIILVVLVALVGAFAVACTQQPEDQSRKEAVQDRTTNFERAEEKHPAPTDLTNFPMRGSLVKFTERQDEVNHPWYVYILSHNGDPVGYYIGETYPQSACNMLSDTTRFVDLPDANWGETSAPSYDGVFYGDGCQTYFFFDIVSDAMYTFAAPNWLASDQPLSLDTQALGDTSFEDLQDVPATPAP